MKNKEYKNYIIFVVTIIVTIIISLYLFSFIKQCKDLNEKTSVMNDVLKEIKYDNFDSYLKERDFLVLYVCTTRENSCDIFEENFKNFVVKYNLTDEIVYFNFGNKKNLVNKIYDKYKSDCLENKIKSYPSIFIFKDGKIADLITSEKNKPFSIEYVEKFMEGYDIIND